MLTLKNQDTHQVNSEQSEDWCSPAAETRLFRYQRETVMAELLSTCYVAMNTLF